MRRSSLSPLGVKHAQGRLFPGKNWWAWLVVVHKASGVMLQLLRGGYSVNSRLVWGVSVSFLECVLETRSEGLACRGLCAQQSVSAVTGCERSWCHFVHQHKQPCLSTGLFCSLVVLQSRQKRPISQRSRTHGENWGDSSCATIHCWDSAWDVGSCCGCVECANNYSCFHCWVLV